MINNAKTLGKHFKFTKATHPVYPELRQIQATQDLQFCRIEKGTVGGWITCAENLEGAGWVAESAMVMGTEARIKGHALLSGHATIRGTSVLSGNAVVMDSVYLANCTVKDRARLTGNVSGVYSTFEGDSSTSGRGTLTITRSVIKGFAHIRAHGYIEDESVIGGNANLHGLADFFGASIEKSTHCLTVGPIGSEGCTAVVYRTLDREGKASHRVKIGCWSGQVEELAEEIANRRGAEWAWEPDSVKDFWAAQYEAVETLARLSIAGWK